MGELGEKHGLAPCGDANSAPQHPRGGRRRQECDGSPDEGDQYLYRRARLLAARPNAVVTTLSADPDT